jgi:hypothetical protein
MFLFLVPFLVTDMRCIGRSDYAYPKWSTLAFHVMNPIIFIVTIMYWGLLWIDPRLVFGDRDPNEFDATLMFYLHGGNFILMYGVCIL